ncbi:hypothetical protein BDV11DRAFT_175585 [Aspergillus similis]
MSSFELISDIVEPQVGERLTTSRGTLVKGSTFFASLFSDLKSARKDSTYFIVADGNLFEYILRFRRPIEARYFGIKKLTRSLGRDYIDAIQVEHTVIHRRDALPYGSTTTRHHPISTYGIFHN